MLGVRIPILLLLFWALNTNSFINKLRTVFWKKTVSKVWASKKITSSPSHKLVSTQRDLDRVVDELASCTEIALDIEFDRNRYSYGFNLCLMQVFDGSNCYILDPLADINLKGLYNIFENDNITKVMHAPGEDIRLMHDIGVYPRNIFDSERAAALVNLPRTSLLSVVKELLGIHLDKSMQKTNWSKRPLSQEQLIYAAADVLYLLKLKQKIKSLAAEREVQHWIAEENSAWDSVRFEKKETLVPKREAVNFSPFHVYVYNGLLVERDKVAQDANKPPNHIICKELMLNMTFNPELNFMTVVEKYWRGIHPKLRQPSAVQQFDTMLQTCRKEADVLGLSKIPPSRLKPSTAMLAEIELEKTKTYTPLKMFLEDKYGVNAANYILPDGIVTRLAAKEISLDRIEFEYRRSLFRSFIDSRNQKN